MLLKFKMLSLQFVSWHGITHLQNLLLPVYGLVTFIIVTMPFHNTQYIMGYNIMAQPHGLTMSL